MKNHEFTTIKHYFINIIKSPSSMNDKQQREIIENESLIGINKCKGLEWEIEIEEELC